MSALPKAVQKQIEEANKIADQLKAAKLVPPADPATPPAPTAPEATPSPEPPAPTQPVAAAPAATPTPTPPAAPVDWEKKYLVLQGKYNSEVPRLTAQLREKDAQIQDLRSQNTALQGIASSLGQRGGSAPANGAPASPAGPVLVKDEEVKQFGEDLTDFIKRVARQTLTPEIDRLKPAAQQVAQVAQTVERVQKQVAQNDSQKVLALLSEQVPNWEEMNNDQEGFLTWLSQLDPFSGATRQELLDQAFHRHDGPRVVAFFKSYLNEHAVVTPPAAPTPPAPPAPAATPVSLDSLVAPGAARPGTTGAPNEAGKRIWSASDINEFNNRKSAYVRARKPIPAEMQALERDLVAAAREGRIR